MRQGRGACGPSVHLRGTYGIYAFHVNKEGGGGVRNR